MGRGVWVVGRGCSLILSPRPPLPPIACVWVAQAHPPLPPLACVCCSGLRQQPGGLPPHPGPAARTDGMLLCGPAAGHTQLRAGSDHAHDGAAATGAGRGGAGAQPTLQPGAGGLVARPGQARWSGRWLRPKMTCSCPLSPPHHRLSFLPPHTTHRWLLFLLHSPPLACPLPGPGVVQHSPTHTHILPCPLSGPGVVQHSPTHTHTHTLPYPLPGPGVV